ncbi:MAG: toxin co-regulated pilus biosynthesis Q family protein [Pseudomonadota bacterium]
MHFNIARDGVRLAILRALLSGALAAPAGAALAQTPPTPPSEPGAEAPRPQRAARKHRPVATPAAETAAAPAPTRLTIPAAPAAPVSWEVRIADRTLSMTFARWANIAGWQLIWELPLDYVIDASTQIGGSFEEAVEAVANSMTSAETPMQVIFYKGNKVLRIVSKVSP